MKKKSILGMTVKGNPRVATVEQAYITTKPYQSRMLKDIQGRFLRGKERLINYHGI